MGQHKGLDQQMSELIETLKRCNAHVSNDLDQIKKQQKKFSKGKISLDKAQQKVEELTPKQPSPTSKYGQAHMVTLKGPSLPEKRFDVENQASGILLSKKKVPFTDNLLDVSQDRNHSTGIGTHLGSIPVNDKAMSDDVKPTKIMLVAHGAPDDDSFIINSPIEGSAIVPSEQVITTLMEQLPKGNYHNKLTIALKTCHAGKHHDSGRSIIDTMAGILKENGYSGIKLTGSTEEIQVTLAGDANNALGGTFINEDGSDKKVSTTNTKRVTGTDDEPSAETPITQASPETPPRPVKTPLLPPKPSRPQRP